MRGEDRQQRGAWASGGATAAPDPQLVPRRDRAARSRSLLLARPGGLRPVAHVRSGLGKQVARALDRSVRSGERAPLSWICAKRRRLSRRRRSTSPLFSSSGRSSSVQERTGGPTVFKAKDIPRLTARSRSCGRQHRIGFRDRGRRGTRQSSRHDVGERTFGKGLVQEVYPLPDRRRAEDHDRPVFYPRGTRHQRYGNRTRVVVVQPKDAVFGVAGPRPATRPCASIVSAAPPSHGS